MFVVFVGICVIVFPLIIEDTLSNSVSMRPSQNTDFNRCSLMSITPQHQRDMFQCFTQCLHNPCCRAVNVKDGCEQSYVETEEMDFVKEVDLMYFVM